MSEELQQLREQSIKELETARTESELYEVKSRYLGRNGRLTKSIKHLKELPSDQRAEFGKSVNLLKQELENAFDQALTVLRTEEKLRRTTSGSFDVSLPGRPFATGHKHPVTAITEEIVAVFSGMGFSVVEGPEIELDFFNFEALNIPTDHPARDMHDTFYITDDRLLRTHTSPVQIRTMQHQPPPLRILCPGKVYRCDSDVSHTPMFHQVEGLMVDDNVSLSDLKGVLTEFVHCLFESGTPVRFRPSYFPFTEPSAELDIQCVMCKGNGCRVCSQTGWLEILGCGLVNPVVFKNSGYDPDTVSGFAFGMGVERIAMLKYNIHDIRLFYENDLRFLHQF